MTRKLNTGRIAFVITGGTILLVALYIMANRLGLVDAYDFGAGSYYYADIPDFEKHVGDGIYKSTLPTWAAIIIFLAWGALMYRIWVWLDERDNRKKEQK